MEYVKKFYFSKKLVYCIDKERKRCFKSSHEATEEELESPVIDRGRNRHNSKGTFDKAHKS